MMAAVFVNGCFTPTLSDLSQLPQGASLRATDNGVLLTVADHCEITQPIKFVYITENNVATVEMQHVIEMGKQSKLTLIDEYQGQTDKTAYAAKMRITQQQDSFVSLVCLKNGAKTSQDTIHVSLVGTGAECQTAGFYHVKQDSQQAHYNVTIEHAAAHTKSDMLFKGIAENKSRAGFIGRLHVHQHAQKINAQQANHHLLLTRDAEVYSKPELEIYADDVKCKHGSTTGELDNDALFYLRARGIAEQDAKMMLIAGFADEVLRRASSEACHPEERFLQRGISI